MSIVNTPSTSTQEAMMYDFDTAAAGSAGRSVSLRALAGVFTVILVLLLGLPGVCLGALGGGLLENQGQVADEVLYYGNIGPASVYFTRDALVLDLREFALVAQTGAEGHDEPRQEFVRGHAVWMRFDGANPAPVVEARYAGTTTYNYFTSDNPADWVTDVSAFEEVVYRDLWPGIDLTLKQSETGIEYEARVADGADPTLVRFAPEGADGVSSTADGDRRIETSVFDIIEHQRRDTARGEFIFTRALPASGNDGGREDPATLLWGTYLGGYGHDNVGDGTLDASGNPILVGFSYSPDFPVTAGAYDTTVPFDPGGHADGYVAKLDAAGTTLIWCTYLGTHCSVSQSLEFLEAVIVDSDGNVIVAGSTPCSNFPTTAGAFQETYGGGFGEDGFITKLSADGSSLVWSTFLGGGSDGNPGGTPERVYDLALDADDNVYATGFTNSPTFPVTAGSYDETKNSPMAGSDAFVSKLSADGSTLLWSTYAGGSSDDIGNGIAVSSTGECFVTGSTESSDFPTTLGAYDTGWNGPGQHILTDAYVLRVASDGSDLVWSSYLGGGDGDIGNAIELDSSGNPVVCGETEGVGFPTTPGAFHTDHYVALDGFITKMDVSGSAIIWSTYWRGYAKTTCKDLALDSSDNVVFTGQADGRYWLACTADAYSSSGGTSADQGYMAKLDSSGSSLLYGSYVPSNTITYYQAVAADVLGDGVIFGQTGGLAAVTTSGAFDPTHNGHWDGFALRFDLPGAAENIVVLPETQDVTVAAPVATVDVDYLGGGSGLLYGYSLKLTWDPTIAHTSVHVDSIMEGTLLSGLGTTFFDTYRTGPHEITIDGSLLGALAGTSGPGTLLTIKFTGLAYGTCPIDIEILEVRDRYNNDLTGFATEDGELVVDVQAPVVADVLIVNDTLAHTDEFVKNTDAVTITATVTDDDPTFAASNIVADLTGLGGGGAVNPSYIGTTATWTLSGVTCSPSDGTVTVTVDATDAIGNPAAQGADDITSDNTLPDAVTGLDASPAHEEVGLLWDDPASLDDHAYGILIRYDETTDYPFYIIAEPSYPASPDAGLGTAYYGLLPVLEAAHCIEDRGVCYYTAFVFDYAMNYSPADPTAQDRATNYWLGDVADGLGSWGYNGLVTVHDIDKLGGTYAVVSPGMNDAECNVGPTDDNSRVGIPLPNAGTGPVVDFEDLMIFSMNYGVVAPRIVPLLSGMFEGELALSIEEVGLTDNGVELALVLSGNSGEVKGASSVLELTGAEFISARLSDEMTSPAADVFFWSGETGEGVLVDLAILGTDVSIGGSGELARLTVAPMSEEYSVSFTGAKLRSADNDELTVELEGIDITDEIPTAFRLVRNVPNPFNPVTTIAYHVPHESEVTIRVYDVTGRVVKTLVDRVTEPGRHAAVWDGRNERGDECGSGVYFCVMETPEYRGSSKMMLLK